MKAQVIEEQIKSPKQSEIEIIDANQFKFSWSFFISILIAVIAGLIANLAFASIDKIISKINTIDSSILIKSTLTVTEAILVLVFCYKIIYQEISPVFSKFKKQR